ncbi:MAG: OmpA family protein [Alphaproteobacteria bacterium]|nr:OmpA family protein [Alphaproteobacteria bacterium]
MSKPVVLRFTSFARCAVLAILTSLMSALPVGTTQADDAVQVYTDNGADQASHPLSAGQLSLKDILKPKTQPKTALPDITAGGVATSAPASLGAPALSKTSQTGATSSMMLQGMKSAIQSPSSGALAAPSLANVPVPAAASLDMASAPSEEAPAAQYVSDDNQGSCVPHITTWTKTCAEAGYPDSINGYVNGETRTICPSGAKQDVLVANSCGGSEAVDRAMNEAIQNTGAAPATPSSNVGMAGFDQPVNLQATGDNEGAAIPAQAAIAQATNEELTTGPRAASCGTANGLAATVKPLTELCASGTASDVAGEGPWHWSCAGVNGGMSVSCAAPVGNVAAYARSRSERVRQELQIDVEDGQCGIASGQPAGATPATGLCDHGVPSRVNGSGPWSWACSGKNGGAAAACSAPHKTDGICGTASSTGSSTMPTHDLCAAGYASAVTGTGPWNWTCSGLYGGQANTCAATPRLNAVCGAATTVGHKQQPLENLCSVGEASAVNGTGPWNWTCTGVGGGSSVTCEARASLSGICGAANGVTVVSAPKGELCASGKASRVVGAGPWTWDCSGTDGGDIESCTAPVQQAVAAPVADAAKIPATQPQTATASAASTQPAPTTVSDLCGGAAEMVAFSAPTYGLCKNGTASAVAGEGPWAWTCSDNAGHQSACATLTPTGVDADGLVTPSAAPRASVQSTANATKAAALAAPVPEVTATCGPSAGHSTQEAPLDGLCSVGKAGAVRGGGPWNWTCSKAKSKVECQADKLTDGQCGTANGTSQKAVPVSGLCAAGTATEVQGDGPWLWSCVGTGGGASSSCSAASQAQVRVDGICGAAANGNTTGAPSQNLCDSGVPSAVYGDGPWTWTCSGANGGVASSCSAQRNSPVAPPPPGPAINGLCGGANGVAQIVQPMDNLCATGTSTPTSGNGPWNWNCLGENGGMTVSCTAPLQPPEPISGACGTANGVTTLVMPRSGLCDAGIASAVSGHGPWTWSCSGVNGGSAVGCVAPLAGTDKVGALPSLVTPLSPELSAPQIAPVPVVKGSALVTPKLTSGTLQPLDTGTLPAVPSMDATAHMVPPQMPDLPAETQEVTPPPVRDTLQPSPALRPAGYDDQGNLIAGNHVVLPDAYSTISFQTGVENFDNAQVPTLDGLVSFLKQSSAVRITLTAYAGTGQGVTPRDARRISLSRALAVRDYLTTKGVSSSRIDVRALGGNVPSGDPERIDVKAN